MRLCVSQSWSGVLKNGRIPCPCEEPKHEPRSFILQPAHPECDAVLIGKLNNTEDLEQYAASFFRIYAILEFLRPLRGCENLIRTAAGE
jgi:hypothetical protein